MKTEQTEATQWIKTSERAPTRADLPVWAHYKSGNIALIKNIVPEECTHWRPAASDVPAPPREETQHEKDEAMFAQLHGESWQGATPEQKEHHAGRRIGFFTALAYERKQVLKLTPISHPNQFTKEYTLRCVDAISEIRARCEGGRK